MFGLVVLRVFVNGGTICCCGLRAWCVVCAARSFEYDYAIYVQEAQEVLYDDCDQVMEDGAASGAYMLTSGNWACVISVGIDR